MNKNLIYIPFAIILIIQFFDKEDKYFNFQIGLLIIMAIMGLYFLITKKNENEN